MFPIYNNFDNLPEFVSKHNIQEVWIALPMSAEKHIERVAEEMMQNHCNCEICTRYFWLAPFATPNN